MSNRPRVGVSSCLLGERVRYDGAEKGVEGLRETLISRVELVPICPEVGAGMPVPRPPIQLVERGGRGLVVELVAGSGDVHTPMREFCETTRNRLLHEPLHGYLFKARSPSCGVVDTPHFSQAGDIVRKGAGLWAQTLMTQWPDMPTADESVIADSSAYEAFLDRVFAYWQGDPT